MSYSALLLNWYRSLSDVINLHDTLFPLNSSVATVFSHIIEYVYHVLKLKHYYFHNSHVLTLFFLKEVEECCVIRIPRHDIAMYLMDICEIEIVVSWVYTLSFWLTVFFIKVSFLFFFFPHSLEGNL